MKMKERFFTSVYDESSNYKGTLGDFDTLKEAKQIVAKKSQFFFGHIYINQKRVNEKTGQVYEVTYAIYKLGKQDKEAYAELKAMSPKLVA
jgi:hypothetical protein